MKQQEYELILTCIQRGVPVLADQLIASLNMHLDLANKYIDEHKDDDKPKTTKKTKGE